MKDPRIDRLYELLPAIYRMRDVEQGEPLRALLQVISEQVNLVEDDIRQLNENWFIETCEDWVVPYLAELIGYEPVHEAGEPTSGNNVQEKLRNKILIPRREVANTIRYRRRKGSLALLELLASDIAGWPARAVEFYQLLAHTQSVKHLKLMHGKTLDIRDSNCLELLNGPFDKTAHNVDIRRINSKYTQGRYNLPGVGVFVWRLKAYSVTGTPAYCLESAGPNCFTFSALGNNTPLYNKPEPETESTHITEEFNLPVPIRRTLFEKNLERFYGDNKSLVIYTGAKKVPVSIDDIVVSDLNDWRYFPPKGKVAVDPELGRIAFPKRTFPKSGVWVNYHYGFSADVGGGEYERPMIHEQTAKTYRVGRDEKLRSINAALDLWKSEKPEHASIEITDSGVYVEPINIDCFPDDNLNDGSSNNGAEKIKLKSLELRSANRKRPIIRLLDWQTDKPDSLSVNGDCLDCFILDGVLVTGRGVQINGALCDLTIRHSTLVPGWEMDSDCKPDRTEPSLEIFSPNVCVKIERSILGAIQVDSSVEIKRDDKTVEYGENEDFSNDSLDCADEFIEVRLDPIRICISDSIVDATDPEIEVIGAPGCPVAHVCLSVKRSTIFGHTQVHAIELAENTIFDGRITVARRQKGCIRFCYVTSGSRTPRRYRCQPDLVTSAIAKKLRQNAIEQNESSPSFAIIQAAQVQESLRVHPRFNSVRYGKPTYCQLTDCCAEEIKRGANDESEMGVFHHLYQPQRMANLSVRLNEYLPAHMDVGIIKSS